MLAGSFISVQGSVVVGTMPFICWLFIPNAAYGRPMVGAQ